MNTKDLSLTWNPKLKIYIDYEFLLKCICHWGRESFRINPSILVNYAQTNQGMIGKSNYQDWAKELEWIIAHKESYLCLNKNDVLGLDRLKSTFLARHQEIQKIAAFTK